MSFKLKLVAYFVLLALLPLAAAFAAFSSVVARSETRLVDAQLSSALRGTVDAYEAELALAERAATGLATDPGFQRALADFDAAALRKALRGSPALRLEAGGIRLGKAYELAAERRIAVISSAAGSGRELGTVIASLPFDGELAERLRRQSDIREGESVVFVAEGRIVGGPAGLRGERASRASGAATISTDAGDFRVATAMLRYGGGVTAAVLTPQSRIDAAANADRLRLLLALAASLVLVALVAYVQGRSIVSALRRLVEAADRLAAGRLGERVAVRGKDEFAVLARSFNEMAEQLEARLEDVQTERRRLRDTIAHLGEALSSTYEPEQLLRAIVDTAVQATSADGALLVGRDGKLVRVGDPKPDSERLDLPLVAAQNDFGVLALFGRGFSAQDVETATLLVGHAAVALENARLHRIVEHEALVDALTGLANRRRAEDALVGELARAERFGSPLAVILADLDGFKGVNDRYGHPTGDAALREFAAVLEQALRAFDVAARWGGEEFMIILPATDAAGAAHVAERIRASFARQSILTPEATPITSTASFGVAEYPAATSAAALIAAADAALYEAKRAGRNRVATASAPAHSAPGV